MSVEEIKKKALEMVEKEEQSVLAELEKARYEKQNAVSVMASELKMIRQKVYSFNELIDYLKMLHEAGGDDAVVSYLTIYGDISKIDDSLDELEELEDALWSYDSQMFLDFNYGRRKCKEIERIFKRKEELVKKRKALTNSIGMMSDSMFGYKRNHSKYKYM